MMRMPENSLYDPSFEHDACGVGFVADIGGNQSHAILEMGIRSVVNLTHRGAVDADAKTGDGAGILTQIPSQLFKKDLDRLGYHLDEPAALGVGVLFMPRDDRAAHDVCRTIVEESITEEGLQLLGWRTVPLDLDHLGQKAQETRPDIQQVLVGRPDGMDADTFERLLYLARRALESRACEKAIEDFYCVSFSHQRIVYKALVVAPQLDQFYLDLKDPAFETALCVIHQRYSTNTFPTWSLAQPMRFLAHNGEINTLKGNRNWMRAREPELHTRTSGARRSIN